MKKRLSTAVFALLTLLTAGTQARTLVVYYSYTGNCREIATTLTNQIQADILEIRPAEKGQKYDADNYALGTQMLNTIKNDPDNAASYPAIDPVNITMEDYENIVVITPLWWSKMAAIMQSFLFRNASDMSGKHVGLIVSSHSSSIGTVISDAKRLLPDVTWTGDALWINAANHQSRATLIEEWLKAQNFQEKQSDTDIMYITANGHTFPVMLEDNVATRELTAILQQSPITFEAEDYGGFEKVGDLGCSLTRDDRQTTTKAGDVVLYNGSNIVLFYGSNTWDYTRLGCIQYESPDDLESFLKPGQGKIRVTLSLTAGQTHISQLCEDRLAPDTYYTLGGRKTTKPTNGLYIRNNKKIRL